MTTVLHLVVLDDDGTGYRVCDDAPYPRPTDLAPEFVWCERCFEVSGYPLPDHPVASL